MCSVTYNFILYFSFGLIQAFLVPNVPWKAGGGNGSNLCISPDDVIPQMLCQTVSFHWIKSDFCFWGRSLEGKQAGVRMTELLLTNKIMQDNNTCRPSTTLKFQAEAGEGILFTCPSRVIFPLGIDQPSEEHSFSS